MAASCELTHLCDSKHVSFTEEQKKIANFMMNCNYHNIKYRQPENKESFSVTFDGIYVKDMEKIVFPTKVSKIVYFKFVTESHKPTKAFLFLSTGKDKHDYIKVELNLISNVDEDTKFIVYRLDSFPSQDIPVLSGSYIQIERPDEKQICADIWWNTDPWTYEKNFYCKLEDKKYLVFDCDHAKYHLYYENVKRNVHNIATFLCSFDELPNLFNTKLYKLIYKDDPVKYNISGLLVTIFQFHSNDFSDVDGYVLYFHTVHESGDYHYTFRCEDITTDFENAKDLMHGLYGPSINRTKLDKILLTDEEEHVTEKTCKTVPWVVVEGMYKWRDICKACIGKSHSFAYQIVRFILYHIRKNEYLFYELLNDGKLPEHFSK